MNIMILNDRKGFILTKIVPYFRPEYSLVERPDFSIATIFGTEKAPRDNDFKEIKFYPKGAPVKEGDNYILNYYEIF